MAENEIVTTPSRKSKINWKDPEAVKQYQREMYRASKPKPTEEEKKTPPLDWTNQEQVKEYRQKYYKDNRARIVNVKKEKVMCDICQVEVCKDSVYKHKLTRLHKVAHRLYANHIVNQNIEKFKQEQ